jgi:hypothetical protein
MTWGLHTRIFGKHCITYFKMYSDIKDFSFCLTWRLTTTTTTTIIIIIYFHTLTCIYVLPLDYQKFSQLFPLYKLFIFYLPYFQFTLTFIFTLIKHIIKYDAFLKINCFIENIFVLVGPFFLFSNFVLRLLVSRRFDNKCLVRLLSKYNGAIFYLFFISFLSISTTLLTTTQWKSVIQHRITYSPHDTVSE